MSDETNRKKKRSEKREADNKGASPSELSEASQALKRLTTAATTVSTPRQSVTPRTASIASNSKQRQVTTSPTSETAEPTDRLTVSTTSSSTKYGDASSSLVSPSNVSGFRPDSCLSSHSGIANDDTQMLSTATKSIESVFASPMFAKLYNIQQQLASTPQVGSANMLPTCSETEEESDDSYAAQFNECIKKVAIFKCNTDSLVDSGAISVPFDSGGLFRLILLRNVRKQSATTATKNKHHHHQHNHQNRENNCYHTYLFLIKLKQINLKNLKENIRQNATSIENKNEIKRVFHNKRPNEVWLWWRLVNKFFFSL